MTKCSVNCLFILCTALFWSLLLAVPSYGQSFDIADWDFGSAAGKTSLTENGFSFHQYGGAEKTEERLQVDSTHITRDPGGGAGNPHVVSPVGSFNPPGDYTFELVYNTGGIDGGMLEIDGQPDAGNQNFDLRVSSSRIDLCALAQCPNAALDPANLGLDMAQPHTYTIQREGDGPGSLKLYIDNDFSAPVVTTQGNDAGRDQRMTIFFLGKGTQTDPDELQQLHSIRIGNGLVFGEVGPEPRSFTWISTDSGDWNVRSNWSPSGSPGIAPNGNHDAIFSDTTSAGSTVYTDTAVTVRRINFDHDQTYVVAGFGSVNLVSGTDSTGDVAPVVDTLQGSHEFQVRVNLHNDSTVNVATDSTLTFNNALNLNGNTLTKAGAGTMSIRNDFVEGTGALNITEGTVSGNGTVAGSVDNSGGTIAPGNSPGVLSIGGDLNNGASGTIAMEIAGTDGAGEAQGHDQIQVAGSSTLDGTLAITTGGSYSDPTTRAARDNFTLIASAGGSTGNFATVSYDGTELSSDFAGDNGSFRAHVGNGLFRNLNYDGNDVSLTNLFALEGDADGDMDIDITDFNILASNFDGSGVNSATNNWTTADFDADGDIDITDFNFLASNFADSGYGGAEGSQVPEPGSLLLLVLGGVLMGWVCGRRH